MADPRPAARLERRSSAAPPRGGKRRGRGLGIHRASHAGGPFRFRTQPGRTRHRLVRRRHGLVSQAVLGGWRAGGRTSGDCLRRRLHEQRRLAERQPAGQSPVRIHQLRLRPDASPAARRRECAGGARAQRGQNQPLVFRIGHLPACPCQRDRRSAPSAVGRICHHSRRLAGLGYRQSRRQRGEPLERLAERDGSRAAARFGRRRGRTMPRSPWPPAASRAWNRRSR